MVISLIKHYYMNEMPNNFNYEKNYQDKLKNIAEKDKINNLDDLAIELKRIAEAWRVLRPDEQALRNRELLIHEALLRLKLDLDWKNSHTDLFVDYLQVGDDENLIELIKKEFNLQQVSSRTEIASQIKSEIDIAERLNSQESLTGIVDLVDNDEIIEKEGKLYKN